MRQSALVAIELAEREAELAESEEEDLESNETDQYKDWFIDTSDKWADKLTDLFEDLDQEGN